MKNFLKTTLIVVLFSYGAAAFATAGDKPAASIDLMTKPGVERVGGAWRYSDVDIVKVDFKAPGPEGQPTGPVNKTYDLYPHAGGATFDDSGWEVIAPTALNKRRGGGRLSFNWYRIRLTVPERIDGFDPTGSTIVFDTSVDDYAEIWVDGELPRAFKQSGGSVIKGWNADNRLIVARGVRPGDQVQLAIFGVNGPISAVPTNYIYMRRARLEFFSESEKPVGVKPQEVNVEVERLDPAIDSIIPANPKLFKLAEGFEFIEGPVWTPAEKLLFSDPNANRIYEYTDDRGLRVFREQSGYAGADIERYHQPGSNGLTLDADGRLTIDEHGNRRVTRLEPNGKLTILADNYKGKRLNSPNDLVYKSDGTLYFTDPPFGLPAVYDDPAKELDFSGIYRIRNGRTQLLAKDLIGPNGIAFSPDEDFLYVGNWDLKRKIVMRYPVRRDGRLGRGEVFFDMNGAPGEEALDGLKIDASGNLYVSGPGGVWVLSSEGKHLGTIRAPRLPANFAWGGKDGKSLYMTARSTLYRMPLKIAGIRP